ncbi:protocatechuate 4,5-dioxygenase subunit alpha [Maribrevibacterium harenarium]|jgi:protocatechuate 4,5-dioxygenase alpha chain|uniref:Protocatechuate 4,5-dioxygenase subunit alpha n=1 Tax=Maribrevibacterium harenarium TaxID=2589817 RepID=A0A501WDJ9_9GAMM|nr:protocatechuate 4,5-dioxygenase subunit alpha [Maribrevibacterium harenarium]TPE46912.1 protocatechuate 4,5-dioxygenase subunit alpha [Maribrevibacterium harenarium]
MSQNNPIPGTYFMDGPAATKGYPLNKMCYSFNNAEARAEFLRDEEAYFDKFKLSEEQKEAVRKRDVIALLEAGGSIYYLAKFAGIFGLNVQDVGGLQTGMTTEEFKAFLVQQGELVHG